MTTRQKNSEHVYTHCKDGILNTISPTHRHYTQTHLHACTAGQAVWQEACALEEELGLFLASVSRLVVITIVGSCANVRFQCNHVSVRVGISSAMWMYSFLSTCLLAILAMNLSTI